VSRPRLALGAMTLGNIFSPSKAKSLSIALCYGVRRSSSSENTRLTYQNPASTWGSWKGFSLFPYIASVLALVTNFLVQENSSRVSFGTASEESNLTVLWKTASTVSSKSLPGAKEACMTFNVSFRQHGALSSSSFSERVCKPSADGVRMRFANCTTYGAKEMFFEFRSTPATILGELTT